MYSAVRRYDFQQSVCIGGFELCEHAVFKHIIYYRVLAAELFKHIGICAVAGLGLLPERQHESVKQHLAELFRRIYIELAACISPDIFLKPCNIGVQAFAEVIQRFSVDVEAFALHIRQHLTQRQLGRVVKPVHIKFSQLAVKYRIERIYCLCAVLLCSQITLGNSLEAVITVRRFKKICRKRRIKDKSLGAESLIHQKTHCILYIASELFYIGAEHCTQKSVVALPTIRPCSGINLLSVAQLYTVHTIKRLHRNIFRLFHRRDKFISLLIIRKFYIFESYALFLGRNTAVAGSYPPLFNEFIKTQTLEHSIERRSVIFIPYIVLRVKFYRDFAQYRCEPVGLAGAALTCRKLFTHALLYIQPAEIFVYFIHRAETADKIKRSLFADSGNAGNVVRRVAHKRLEVGHKLRLKAVFLTEPPGSVHYRLRLPHAGLYIADGSSIAYKLQTVLVAGDYRAVPAFFFADACSSAEYIVRFISLKLITADAHIVKHFLEYRHLYGELVRHRLALSLICLAGTVAKGRRFEVEADAHCVRVYLIQQPSENGKKAINRICRCAVRRVELPHPVKCAVYYAVAVKDHQSHGTFLAVISLFSAQTDYLVAQFRRDLILQHLRGLAHLIFKLVNKLLAFPLSHLHTAGLFDRGSRIGRYFKQSAHVFHYSLRDYAVRLIIRHLLFAAAGRLINTSAHGRRNRIAVHYDHSVCIARGAAYSLDKASLASEEALLICIKYRN